MNAQKDYFKQWKSEKGKVDNNMNESIENFFAVKESNALPPNREKVVQQQDKKLQSVKNRTESWVNPAKVQVGIFYDNQSEQANLMEIKLKSHQSNNLFRPTSYTSPEWRQDLFKSFYRAEHHQGQLEGVKQTKEFNMRKTLISEYSNAIHNKNVFPENCPFTSC